MTTTEFMETVWQGPAEEVARCRECLMALGEDGEADRLRDLLAAIVRCYRRQSGVPWPAGLCINDPQGQPVTPQDIARTIGWPQSQIDADLDKLVAVGLLRYEPDL